MEELGDKRHLHLAHDWSIRSGHLCWSISSHDYCNKTKFEFKCQLPTNSFVYWQTLAVQVKCFAEIINIGYAVYKIHGLPWFRSLSWYFLIASNYFFYGESLVDYFGVVDNRTVIKFYPITKDSFYNN